MKKRHFTAAEVSELAYEGVEIIEGENRRWSRTNTTIVKVEDKHYMLYWEEGLTENQEDQYEDQDASEVELKEVKKIIICKEWIEVE